MKLRTALFASLLCLMATSASSMTVFGPCKTDKDCASGQGACRWIGNEYNAHRCIVSHQNEACSASTAGRGSNECAGNLVCRESGERIKGGGSQTHWYRCVGRGQQNDFCARADAGTGSKSCGGNLVCRNAGNEAWHCIGRGNAGDICSQEEAGHGSKNCGGRLVCRSDRTGTYRCG
jgi:hypothetical protein